MSAVASYPDPEAFIPKKSSSKLRISSGASLVASAGGSLKSVSCGSILEGDLKPHVIGSPHRSNPLEKEILKGKGKTHHLFLRYMTTVPKYLLGIKLQMTSFDPSSGIFIEGPDDVGTRDTLNSPNYANVAALSISTYPHLPGAIRREGNPICDRYTVHATSSATLLMLADGCGWGDRARDAANASLKSFIGYIEPRICKAKDVHRASELLLKGFAVGHGGVLGHTHVPGENIMCSDCTKCGSTTLIAGLLLPLEQHTEEGSKTKWGFVCCSLGDCKVFAISRRRVTDVTYGSRSGLRDVTDCGGRLGPTQPDTGIPDLRNLQVYFTPLDEDDMLLMVSDGVHDNFDPEYLGKTPEECQVKGGKWACPEGVAAKELYMSRYIEDVIASLPDQKPATIVDAIVKYCKNITKPSRKWMKSNKGRLPVDYTRFPGKMDHTTCICIQVPKKAA